MDSDLVRQEMELYILERGVKYRWIARQINISEPMLNHFKKGRRDLNNDDLESLHNLICDN